ncbi:heavy metal-binding domain-containing protein [Ferruginibacter profundus]
MKQFRIILSMAVAAFSFTAVNAQSAKAKTDSVAKDTVVYQCPMKCEGSKTYDKAGKCPKCGMNLKAVAKPAVVALYQCPMKCEGDKTYDKAGKCPKCNMNLAKVEKKIKTENHQGHIHN